MIDGRYTRLSIMDLASKDEPSTYDLAQVMVPADGVAGGVPAYAWRNARQPKS